MENKGGYYCIKTDLSENGEIYAWANDIKIDNGDLILIGINEIKTLSLSKGNWKCFYIANVVDGSCLTVEHWKGEYIS